MEIKKYGMSTDTSIRVMNCSKSGEIIKEGINLCPYCGKKVNMDRLIIKEIDKGKDNRSPSVGFTEKGIIPVSYTHLTLPTNREV